MKIVLLENLRKLGTIGDIINVKRGYARNFLIPEKKALFASEKNIKEVEKIKTDLNKKDQEKKKIAKEIADKLKNKIFEIKKLVTENKEFPDGSLIVGSPAKAVKELDDKTIANLTRSSKHYVDNFKKFSKELKEIK